MEALLELGFEELQAREALSRANGDVERAANLLLSKAVLVPQPAAVSRTGQNLQVPEDEDCKCVFCVRQDLGMSLGKMCAQTGHAAVNLVLPSTTGEIRAPSTWFNRWNSRGGAKIVLGISSEEELLSIAEEARRASLPYTIVRDAGRTEIPSGSQTVVAIGPAPKPLIDIITGKLRLL